MFGNEDEITDDVLLNAVRKRLLQELMREQQGQSPNIDIQNIVGGGAPQEGGGVPPGVFEGMRGEAPQEPEMDYGVDITRSKMWQNPNAGQEGQDPFLPPGIMPQVGEGMDMPDPIGWRKSVRRFRNPRGQDIERKKKT